jgi:hypothetical protein
MGVLGQFALVQQFGNGLGCESVVPPQLNACKPGIQRFGANPEWKRAASCRPTRCWPLRRRSGCFPAESNPRFPDTFRGGSHLSYTGLHLRLNCSGPKHLNAHHNSANLLRTLRLRQASLEKEDEMIQAL